MLRLTCSVIGVLLWFAAVCPSSSAVVPPLMNYQGYLTNLAGAPQDTTLVITFSIYDVETGGVPIWSETQGSVVVTSGAFSILLGSVTLLDDTVFARSSRWLGMKLEPDPEMIPRRRLVTLPYAFRVASVDGARGGTIVSKLAIGMKNSNSGEFAFVAGVRDTASGDNSVVSGGEDNTASATHCVIGGGFDNAASGWVATVGGGTSDTAAGDWATVSGGASNVAGASYAAVGGGSNNRASSSNTTVAGEAGNNATGPYSTVAGGASASAGGGYSVIGGGQDNTAEASYTTVAGGQENTAGESHCSIGGGYRNSASGFVATIAGGTSDTASGGWSAIGGGANNRASGSYSTIGGGTGHITTKLYATVGGGQSNTAVGNWATVAGGGNNTCRDTAATVGGGRYNKARGHYSVISGGGGPNATDSNLAKGEASVVGGGRRNVASGDFSTVAGGEINKAGGWYATVPGGVANEATGGFSFAAGRRAKALHDGAFVWADGNDVNFSSDTVNQFSVRATGGTRFWSTLGPLPFGVKLNPGALAWVSVSDSSAKRNIRLVDGRDILSRLARLPISRWSYKSQDPGLEHIGPMAQDFYELFGVGSDDKTISTLDPDGIALAAIQELHKQNVELKKTDRGNRTQPERGQKDNRIAPVVKLKLK
jgi:hypothetical protein